MSLSDEIFRALTGQAPGRDAFGAMLHETRQAYTSRREMSRKTGIPETTLRRWDKGLSSKGQQAALPRITAAYRHLLVNGAAAARWRANGMKITVRDVPTKGHSGRFADRELSASQLQLRPGTGDKVVNAFLAGDDRGAARAFVAGIGNQWYRNTMFGGWIARNDEDLSDLAYEGDGYDDGGDYAVAVAGAA